MKTNYQISLLSSLWCGNWNFSPLRKFSAWYHCALYNIHRCNCYCCCCHYMYKFFLAFLACYYYFVLLFYILFKLSYRYTLECYTVAQRKKIEKQTVYRERHWRCYGTNTIIYGNWCCRHLVMLHTETLGDLLIEIL